MLHWLWFHAGLSSGNSPWYLFPSGWGSNLAYLGFIWGGIILYRKHNCKRAWCPFLGQYPFTDPKDGVTRNLCAIHHPDVLHKTLKAHHISAIHARRVAVRETGHRPPGSATLVR